MTTPEISAELLPGAEITGTITDSATGAPLAGAEACAFTAADAEEIQACAISEADGDYVIRGLPSGEYKLGFFARGFTRSYYPGKAALAEGETITVLAPRLTDVAAEALTPAAPEPLMPASAGETGAAKVPGTGTATSTPQGTLSLLAARLGVSRDGQTLVRLACAGAAGCRAEAALEIRRKVKFGRREELRTITIGTSAVITIAAGRHVEAVIRLDGEGRRALRAGRGRLQAVLKLVSPGQKRERTVKLVEQTRSNG